MSAGDAVAAAATMELRHHDGRRWCALRTRGRHEKKVARACAEQAVPCYLPLLPHRTFSGGKLSTFQVPLFSGYVFAALGDGDLGDLLRTHSVAQRIEAPSEDRLLADLGSVAAVEAARVEAEVAPMLARGQRVMVAAGPLAGLVGVVRQHRNRLRLQIAVEAIAQGLLVDVSRDAVLPL